MTHIIATNKYKNPSKVKKKGKDHKTLEDWLNSDEDFNRSKEAKDCDHKCKNVLDHMFTKRLIRIASFSQIIGIYWDEYQELCDLCREQLYKWFFNNCWKDFPNKKTTREIWEYEIQENNFKESYESSKAKYDQMLRDYRYNLAKITKQDIEGQERYVDQTYEIWQNSLVQLREAIDREDAIQKGYEV